MRDQDGGSLLPAGQAERHVGFLTRPLSFSLLTRRASLYFSVSPPPLITGNVFPLSPTSQSNRCQYFSVHPSRGFWRLLKHKHEHKISHTWLIFENGVMHFVMKLAVWAVSVCEATCCFIFRWVKDPESICPPREWTHSCFCCWRWWCYRKHCKDDSRI